MPASPTCLSYHAYFLNMEGADTTGEDLHALQEIRQALDLAPNDPKVQEIATQMLLMISRMG